MKSNEIKKVCCANCGTLEKFYVMNNCPNCGYIGEKTTLEKFNEEALSTATIGNSEIPYSKCLKEIVAKVEVVIEGLPHDYQLSDDNLEKISGDISIRLEDDGTITENGKDYDWYINDRLTDKAKILEETEKVMFEHNQLIYEVFLRSDGDYEVNIYSFDDFISGDELEAVDGGCCTGSAKDAVEFML